MPKAQIKDSPVVARIPHAKQDLNYVMDKYLPAKLKHPEKLLP